MATQADILGTAGPGTKHTINGVDWFLTRSTKGIQAAWSTWLLERVENRNLATAEKYRSRARQKYRQAKLTTRESLGEAAWEQLTADEKYVQAAEREELRAEAVALEQEAVNIVERFNDRAAAGEFEFTGNVGINLGQRNLAGIIQLAWLCLKPKHPTLTHDEVVELFKGEDATQGWMQAILKSEGVTEKNGQLEPSVDTAPMTTT